MTEGKGFGFLFEMGCEEQRVRFQEYHKDRKVIRKVIRDAIPVFSRGGGIKLWTNWKLLNSWRACGSTARA